MSQLHHMVHEYNERSPLNFNPSVRSRGGGCKVAKADGYLTSTIIAPTLGAINNNHNCRECAQ